MLIVFVLSACTFLFGLLVTASVLMLHKMVLNNVPALHILLAKNANETIGTSENSSGSECDDDDEDDDENGMSNRLLPENISE